MISPERDVPKQEDACYAEAVECSTELMGTARAGSVSKINLRQPGAAPSSLPIIHRPMTTVMAMSPCSTECPRIRC